MFNRRTYWRSLALIAGAFMFSAITYAGGLELAGFGGGITLDGGIGTHPAFAGSAGYRLGDNIHLFGEFSYSTLYSTAFSDSSSGVTGNASVKLANFGGGPDDSFGSASSRVRPYVTASLGVGHFYGTGSGSDGSGNSASVSVGIANAFYSAAGAGVRLYVGKHWGVKPEVRYQR